MCIRDRACTPAPARRASAAASGAAAAALGVPVVADGQDQGEHRDHPDDPIAGAHGCFLRGAGPIGHGFYFCRVMRIGCVSGIGSPSATWSTDCHVYVLASTRTYTAVAVNSRPSAVTPRKSTVHFFPSRVQ